MRKLKKEEFILVKMTFNYSLYDAVMEHNVSKVESILKKYYQNEDEFDNELFYIDSLLTEKDLIEIESQYKESADLEWAK